MNTDTTTTGGWLYSPIKRRPIGEQVAKILLNSISRKKFKENMITRLYIDNFKSLVNFELKLTDLTLLLGPNGVGKTSILDVIYQLRQLLGGIAYVPDRDKPGSHIVFETSSLTRWQQRNRQVFELDLLLDKLQYRYRLEIEHDRTNRRARIVLEELSVNGQPLFRFNKGEIQLYRDNHSPGPVFGGDWSASALARVPPREDNTKLTKFLEFMRKVIVCGIYPTNFTAESSTEDAVLQRDARNFSAWYRHLLLERQELVPEFTKALQEVIPGFRSIRMEKVGLDTRALMVLFDLFQQKFELRLDEVSDGQRALITLYALIKLAAGQGYTLFLDEPENYVALAEIQPWLIELADVSGEDIPQAVICSHHPELIDYLGSERGVVLSQESSGVTTAKPLHISEAQDESKRELKLSELISRGWPI